MKSNVSLPGQTFTRILQGAIRLAAVALLLAFSLLGTAGPVARARAQSGLTITRLAQLADGAYPAGLIYGPQGRYWLTLLGSNMTAWADPAGTTVSTPLPNPAARPFDLTIGPDGALWFTEQAASKIGRLDSVTGQIREYPLPGQDRNPSQIVLGQDGALWFTEYGAGKIGRMALDGTVSEYSLPNPASKPLSIVSAPDGSLWFTEWGRQAIGRIDLDGQISEYTISGATSAPSEIVFGPDGNLWFIFEIGRRIVRLNPDTGEMTSFTLATQNNALTDLAVGADGRLWYTGVQAVGSMAVSPAGPGDLLEAPIKPAFQGGGRSQIAAGPGAEMVFITLNSSEVNRVALAQAGMRDMQVFAPQVQPMVFADGPFDVQLEVVNWSSSPVTNIKLTLTLDENISFVRTADFDGACQTVGEQVLCTIASLAGSTSLPLTLTLQASRIPTYQVDRTLTVEVHGDQGDHMPANNRLVRRVEIQRSFDYTNNFDQGADAYWSHDTIITPGGANPRLGAFSNHNVTLTFAGLPPHDRASMCFDLYITGRWDGDQSIDPEGQQGSIGPDIWAHYLNETRLHVTTFSNQDTFSQSYPGEYEEARNPARSGAPETGDFDGDGIASDARYRLCWDEAHSAPVFKATFYGVNLDEESGERWALDNVRLKIFNEAGFSKVYLPGIVSGQ